MKKGTQALFTESLKYDTPSSTSGGNALYTGLISERGDQWKFTSYGQGVTTTDGYRYDNGGRLTYVKRGSVESNLSYDARGNILFAEGNSYTYSGDRVSTFTPFGQSAVYFTHDSRGRMTYDDVSGVTIDYNYLNLTRKISGTDGTLAKYSYLADGSKSKAENGSGVGLVYRGSLIYRKAAGGSLTLEGARQYSPTLRRRLVPDPLSEKYYGMSPYAYCAGNPVNLVDPDGCVFTERSWQYVLDYLEDINQIIKWRWKRENNTSLFLTLGTIL